MLAGQIVDLIVGVVQAGGHGLADDARTRPGAIYQTLRADLRNLAKTP